MATRKRGSMITPCLLPLAHHFPSLDAAPALSTQLHYLHNIAAACVYQW